MDYWVQHGPELSSFAFQHIAQSNIPWPSHIQDIQIKFACFLHPSYFYMWMLKGTNIWLNPDLCCHKKSLWHYEALFLSLLSYPKINSHTSHNPGFYRLSLKGKTMWLFHDSWISNFQTYDIFILISGIGIVYCVRVLIISNNTFMRSHFWSRKCSLCCSYSWSCTWSCYKTFESEWYKVFYQFWNQFSTKLPLYAPSI